MKHISKKVLLFGALSMLISSVPMQAMENAPADVQKEVAQKQGFFSRWTQKAKSMRLSALMKELNSHWKTFIKATKGDEGPSRKLVWTIRGLLTAIIALVAIQTIGGVAGYLQTRGTREKEGGYPEAAPGRTVYPGRFIQRGLEVPGEFATELKEEWKEADPRFGYEGEEVVVEGKQEE